MNIDTVAPHSNEAEQSVLGCIMLDKNALVEAVSLLNPDDFYNPLHKRIFELSIELSNENKPVDIVTLSSKGVDIECLANIADFTPSISNIKTYALIVKGKSIRRQYILIADEIKKKAIQGHYDNILDFKNDVLQVVDIEVKDIKKESAEINNILTNVFCNIENKFNSNEEFKMSYSMKWLDTHSGGAENTSVTVLAARPSIGKTAFMSQIVLNLCKKGVKCAFFNLEMSKEQLVERAISNLSMVQLNKLKHPKNMNDDDWLKLSKGQSILSNMNLRIYDDIFKVEEIRAVCRELKNKDSLDFIAIDYLQLMDTYKKTNSTNDRISHLSRQIKLLAKELKLPIWLLSQLSRENEKSNRAPKLTDLRDSGSIEQDADNVIFLHDSNYGKYESQSSDTREIEVIIAKQRQGERDIAGKMKFYTKTQLFGD